MTGAQAADSGAVDLIFSQDGTGNPLILIMGLGAAAEAWQPHTQAWSRSYCCVSVDNRGAGASPAPPGPYDTAMMSDDYARLITRLEVGAVPVVGISMGAAIAQQLALRHPDLVSRLVLVACWSRCDRYTTQLFELLTRVRAQADSETSTALLQTLIWTPDWFQTHAAELQAERRQPAPMSLPAFVAQAAACTGHNVCERLSEIQVPTLITAGSADALINPRLSVEVADRIPGARLEMFGESGHTHHWEQLDRFNDLVDRWLRQ
jgi:pimeloyl-ACP methyl ester carboxylesterase